jgi:putative hemolysin
MGSANAVRSLGNGQYSISEMDVLAGNVAEHAARFCASQGGTLKVEGNTTQQGLASGASYAVLIFSCPA